MSNIVPLEDTKTVVLHKPLTKGVSEPVTQLELKEPEAGHMSKALQSSKGNGVDMTLYLIFFTTGVPLVALKTLAARDFNVCADFLGSFSAPTTEALTADESDEQPGE